MDEEDAARQLEVDMEKDVVTCEMPFGSVLFLNNIIPHRHAGALPPMHSDESCSKRFQSATLRQLLPFLQLAHRVP